MKYEMPTDEVINEGNYFVYLDKSIYENIYFYEPSQDTEYMSMGYFRH